MAYKRNMTSLEKSGTVPATGYFDLIPPTNYSPVRGVLCESLTIKDGELSGACYDMSGPSIALTKKYISGQAAQDLQSKINRGGFSNAEEFLMETNILCNLLERRCWFHAKGVNNFLKTEAPKHTQALFGFLPE